MGEALNSSSLPKSVFYYLFVSGCDTVELLYSNENQISHMVHFKHDLESASINIFKESALVQLGQYLKQLMNMSVCQIEQVLMFLILIKSFFLNIFRRKWLLCVTKVF